MSLWEAEFYDKNSKLQQKIAEHFLDLLQEEFKNFPFSGHLLDVGCGTGRLASSIQLRFPGISIIGIDSSKQMIDFANKHFSDSLVSFYHDRAEELKMLDNNSVDAITSFSCLHWVHDQEAAFRAMHRVLKPGGWIGLMYCVEKEIVDPIDRAELQAMHEEPWNKYFKESKQEVECNIVNPKAIKIQLENAGFKINFMETQNFDFVFESMHAFEKWVLACFQQLKLLPSELQLSCAQRIVELYVQTTTHFQPKGSHYIYRVDPFMLIAKKN